MEILAVQRDGDGQDSQATAAHALAASAADFDLMFRQGMELVTAVATRLRQPALHGASSSPEADGSPQIRMAILAHALELNTALQLMRSAREGHLSAGVVRREMRQLLNRLASAPVMSDDAADRAGTDENVLALPFLLRLPAHQLASLETVLRGHMILLAEDDETSADRPHAGGKSRISPHRPAHQNFHLVPRAD